MKSFVVIVATALSLAACGGAAGGGAASVTPTAFTSFSDAPKPGATALAGNTLEATYTADPTTFAVTSISPVVSGNGTMTKTLDSSGATTTTVITGALSGFTGQTSSSGIQAIAASNATGFARTSTSSALEYQSFGIWQTGRTTASGTIGAISAGAPTAGASIPTSGTATFSGGAIGLAVDNAGTTSSVSANGTVNVNFGSRAITLSTTSSYKTNMITGAVAAAPDLNLSGSMTYAPASNAFNGTVTTAGGAYGSTSGRFYGPSAQEVGGTFATTGAGLQTYAGAYGAKR